MTAPTPIATAAAPSTVGIASTDAITLTDICPYATFVRECERSKTATRGQLAWMVRYRAENGLVSSGALIEKRPNPRSKRPTLFVVRSRFIRWLTTSTAAAA